MTDNPYETSYILPYKEYYDPIYLTSKGLLLFGQLVLMISVSPVLLVIATVILAMLTGTWAWMLVKPIVYLGIMEECDWEETKAAWGGLIFVAFVLAIVTIVGPYLPDLPDRYDVTRFLKWIRDICDRT